MPGYDGLVLDHDGVIVDLIDRSRLRQAAMDAFEAVGVDACTQKQVDTLAFGPSRTQLCQLGEQFGVDPGTLWRHRDDKLDTKFRKATRAGRKKLYPGVELLLDRELPLGIASNNQHRVVEFILDYHDLRSEFGTVRAREPTIDSLTQKKPAPTFLEGAIDDLSVGNPLYVGDKETDLIAGQRAGLDTVLIRREHNADLTPETEPTYETESLREVARLLDTVDS